MALAMKEEGFHPKVSLCRANDFSRISACNTYVGDDGVVGKTRENEFSSAAHRASSFPIRPTVPPPFLPCLPALPRSHQITSGLHARLHPEFLDARGAFPMTCVYESSRNEETWHVHVYTKAIKRQCYFPSISYIRNHIL